MANLGEKGCREQCLTLGSEGSLPPAADQFHSGVPGNITAFRYQALEIVKKGVFNAKY